MSAKYSCIAADPPWSFGDKLGKRGAEANYTAMTVDEICQLARGKREDVEETRPGGWSNMNSRLVEVNALALCGKRFKIADDAILFLWRVSSMVEEAYEVVRAWGFEPKSEIVWIKASSTHVAKVISEGARHGDRVETHTLHFGMGRFCRAAHETCIIAGRGKAASLVKSHSERSVFVAPVPRDARGKIVHSAKPPEFYSIVERLVGAEAKKLELFARAPRDGWTTAGNEIGVVKG